jgi:hypothetical protein
MSSVSAIYALNYRTCEYTLTDPTIKTVEDIDIDTINDVILDLHKLTEENAINSYANKRKKLAQKKIADASGKKKEEDEDKEDKTKKDEQRKIKQAMPPGQIQKDIASYRFAVILGVITSLAFLGALIVTSLTINADDNSQYFMFLWVVPVSLFVLVSPYRQSRLNGMRKTLNYAFTNKQSPVKQKLLEEIGIRIEYPGGIPNYLKVTALKKHEDFFSKMNEKKGKIDEDDSGYKPPNPK